MQELDFVARGQQLLAQALGLARDVLEVGVARGGEQPLRVVGDLAHALREIAQAVRERRIPGRRCAGRPAGVGLVRRQVLPHGVEVGRLGAQRLEPREQLAVDRGALAHLLRALRRQRGLPLLLLARAAQRHHERARLRLHLLLAVRDLLQRLCRALQRLLRAEAAVARRLGQVRETFQLGVERFGGSQQR